MILAEFQESVLFVITSGIFLGFIIGSIITLFGKK